MSPEYGKNEKNLNLWMEKEFGSKFWDGYWVWQTSEEGWREHLKQCEYNNKNKPAGLNSEVYDNAIVYTQKKNASYNTKISFKTIILNRPK